MIFTTWLSLTCQYGFGTLLVLCLIWSSLWLCWKIIILRDWWWLAILIACRRHKGELFAIDGAYEQALESWNRRNGKSYIGLCRERSRDRARLAGRAATIERLASELADCKKAIERLVGRTDLMPFMTGSRAYGEPREDSDLDVVVPIPAHLIGHLVRFSDAINQDTLDEYGNGSISFRFGKLNLIGCTATERLQSWRDGTEQLESEKNSTGPVSRDRAVAVFKDLFEKDL